MAAGNFPLWLFLTEGVSVWRFPMDSARWWNGCRSPAKPNEISKVQKVQKCFLFQLSHLQLVNKHISTDKSILLLSNKTQAFKVVDWNTPPHQDPPSQTCTCRSRENCVTAGGLKESRPFLFWMFCMAELKMSALIYELVTWQIGTSKPVTTSLCELQTSSRKWAPFPEKPGLFWRWCGFHLTNC